jgi:hypothetical protein
MSPETRAVSTRWYFGCSYLEVQKVLGCRPARSFHSLEEILSVLKCMPSELTHFCVGCAYACRVSSPTRRTHVAALVSVLHWVPHLNNATVLQIASQSMQRLFVVGVRFSAIELVLLNSLCVIRRTFWELTGCVIHYLLSIDANFSAFPQNAQVLASACSMYYEKLSLEGALIIQQPVPVDFHFKSMHLAQL